MNGDGYVDANLDLLSEEGVGYEIGFGVLSIFKYDFEQAIEYATGGSNEVTTVTYDEEGNAITTTQQNITMQSITIQVHTTHKVLDNSNGLVTLCLH